MGRKMRDIPEGFTSKLVESNESIEKFYETALKSAESMHQKFYSVSRIHLPEDVVQEVLVNVVNRKIDFDESKGRSFGRFVDMLVKNTYIDLLKFVECKRRQTSKETSMSGVVGEDTDGRIEVEDVIGDLDTGIVAVEEDLAEDGFLALLKDVDDLVVRKKNDEKINLHDVVRLKLKGYTNAVIAEELGVKPAQVSKMMKNNQRLLADMYEDYFGIKLD